MFHFENELEKTISEEVQIYTEKEYTSQLISIMLSKDVSSHISISVDSMSLFESNIAFAHYIFQNPRRALQLLDDAFQKVSLNISKSHVLKADMVYKGNLHVRLIALPNLPEVYRSNLPNCSDVGQFLCISGTVVRASTAKMLQYKKLWRCGKCKYEFIIEAEVELGYICEKPLVCNNPEWCNGKNFTLMSSGINTEWCKDYQEIKLQEQVYNLNVGTVPRSMWVILEDDLVESCHPGNDVIVSGVLIQQWKPLFKSCLIDIDLVIIAHNIEVQNKMSSGVISKDMAKEFGQFWQDHKLDALKGRNFILSSICPQVFGLYIVKLAVALVLAGGVQKRSGSSRIRGDSHLLLIGDPGTAKSQFLKFTTKVSSRSVLTSGIGTTNAGLTVSAVKESGRWELEAGALVLADGGICCIDEFSCIKEQDKTCIHEAMEQQTISVAKAGLVCSLNTRCSILAATNPKGKYDENMSISENTALGSPLLSRFDIILVLLDTYNEKWDDMVSSYILDGRNVMNEYNGKLWSVAKMKSYFTLIRHINPKVTADAERILQAYYRRQRSLQSRHSSRTTPRLLQSLIRLAEGHARLMFRSEVIITDAVIAIILVESSMLGNSILEGLSPLHTVFPDNPTAEYVDKAEKVFQNLNIEQPAEESYKYFYEESTLNNLLSDISAVWLSKEDPYIFGSPLRGTSNAESDSHTNEMSTSNIHKAVHISENNEKELFQQSNHSIPYSLPVEVIMAEVHRSNDDVYSTHIAQNEIRDQIVVSDLKQKFHDNMVNIITSENDFIRKTYASKNTETLSVLDQVLEESDVNECNDIEFVNLNSNKINFKNTFNIVASQSTSNDCMNENETKSLKKENSSMKSFAKMSCERSNFDILKELGISPEKDDEENQINPTERCTNISSSLLDTSTSIGDIFPPKRSLADQLKQFAFSRSPFNLQQKLFTDKSVCDNESNNSKPCVILNEKKSLVQMKKHFHADDKDRIQYASKNHVFNMIKSKSKNITFNGIDQNLPNTSNILGKNQHSDTVNNNQSIHMTIRDSNNISLKTSESVQTDQQIITNHSSQTLFVDQTQLTVEKKPISDKLKMFVFSKNRSSKTENSSNNTKES